MKNLLLRLALVLAAILPITDGYDYLFYSCAILALVFFTVNIIIIWISIKNKNHILTNLACSQEGSYVDTGIAILGLTVTYTVSTISMTFIWWLILGVSLTNIIFDYRGSTS